MDTFKIKMSFYEDLEIVKGLIMSEFKKKNETIYAFLEKRRDFNQKHAINKILQHFSPSTLFFDKNRAPVLQVGIAGGVSY